jgi:predicted transcriptional regulator
MGLEWRAQSGTKDTNRDKIYLKFKYKSVEMSVNIQQLLTTVEYRTLDRRHKAVKLIIDHNITIREAANACYLSKSAVSRALDSYKQNRNIGKPGRQTLLKDNEITDFTSKIDEKLENDNKLTYNDIQHIVSY